ncbi:MAG: hypothetical protein IJ421_00345 [Prevotella sp.]|nr:hypothetical protein [Prevotella sp.]
MNTNNTNENSEVAVVVEPDPLAATQAELLVARTKAAASQTASQLTNSMKAARDWVELARELGLAVYERQPEETDTEWLVWTTYRAHYPGRMPSWTALAAECGVSVATVTKAAKTWNFRLRIVEWSRYTDAGMAEERLAAIKAMNAEQLEQAQILSSKITEALTYLDPATLKPSEIAALMKLAADQQRRVVEYMPEKVEGQIISGADAASEAKRTDVAAVSEILNIMASAGALGKQILGVEKKTVTTERMIVGGGNIVESEDDTNE